ncbi:pirin family protein [Pandoraea oxalativorans]|uniref:Pirin n=1 Tax=Pandoraea oxalativorans TaxID=573737 RepID=A0A0E3YCS9_9BURK|nr:pirin family protein [Pandoraea oxalativorans]AKC69932.1 hypothetical protein MB84_11260 [Pandoraea oxalativorans]
MLTHRRWDSLDAADHGWLRAKYHFRVTPSGNPMHRALGPLMVWNDDEIAVDGGFPFHGHRNVEIVTYVRQGVLGHRDTLGSEGTIHSGDVQVMSAGTGIRHSEFNRGDVPLKVYQIWLQPREADGQPRWATKPFPAHPEAGHFTVLASGYADDDGALPIRADARLLGVKLHAGDTIHHKLDPSGDAYLVVAAGSIGINGELMGSLDGVAITNVQSIEIFAFEDAELVMVEAG